MEVKEQEGYKETASSAEMPVSRGLESKKVVKKEREFPSPRPFPILNEEFNSKEIDNVSATSCKGHVPGKSLLQPEGSEFVHPAPVLVPSIKPDTKDVLVPTNTIVATNGDVYQIEPFQLPPPAEIAALFEELRSRRERGNSNLGLLSQNPSPRSAGTSNSLDEQNLWKQEKNKKADGALCNTCPDEQEKSSSPILPNATSDVESHPDYFDPKMFSFASYSFTLLFGHADMANVDPGVVSLHSIRNFLNVPFQLEKFLCSGLFICLDAFLYIMTILPIRFVLSLFLLVHNLVAGFFGLTFLGKAIPLHRTHTYDLMRGMLCITGSFFLSLLNMSRVYHFIRQQTTIKLYALTGMIEIFDKLLCSFGQDAFQLLHWQTKIKPDLFPLIFAFTISACYVVLHSSLYFMLVATLTVAINSADQAMIAVLILNNFSEIKSCVFKKFDKQNLFQLACSDVTERFQLSLFMVMILLVGMAQAGYLWSEVLKSFASGISTMILCEAIADWIKHAFVTKFNSIDASVYQEYSRILRKDILKSHKEKGVLDPMFAITRRIGLSQV
jgi:hypothetical protein